MDSLHEIKWRNASWLGKVTFTVEVTVEPVGTDVLKADVEQIAQAIRFAIEGLGRDVKVTHQRYPD